MTTLCLCVAVVHRRRNHPLGVFTLPCLQDTTELPQKESGQANELGDHATFHSSGEIYPVQRQQQQQQLVGFSVAQVEP